MRCFVYTTARSDGENLEYGGSLNFVKEDDLLDELMVGDTCEYYTKEQVNREINTLQGREEKWWEDEIATWKEYLLEIESQKDGDLLPCVYDDMPITLKYKAEDIMNILVRTGLSFYGGYAGDWKELIIEDYKIEEVK